MGRSTVAELISVCKNINEYNNHGVQNDAIWITHLNSALKKMTDDLKLEETTTISVQSGVEDYTLPDDYYGVNILNEENGSRVTQRRHYDQDYPPGFWVLNKGSNYVLNLKGYDSPQSMTLLYFRYPEVLTLANKDTQKPDVPTMAENALIYAAVSDALKNNNQLGQAQYYDDQFKQEMARANTAWQRARG